MFIKYEIEKTSKKSLYDFLNTFLFKENIKESRYYNVFLYIYFKLKSSYFKRHKSKRKMKFFFVLFSIDYISINKNTMINVKEFFYYIRNRLNIINFFNRANMAEFIFLLLLTHTKNYTSNSILKIKKNKRQRKFMNIFFQAVHLFEYARNDDQFDFLYMKAFFKNVYDHFKFLHYQYLLPLRARSHNVRPRTHALMRYLRTTTPLLQYFCQRGLRYSVPGIGDLVRKDPKWVQTFILTFEENVKVKFKIRKFRELFRCRLAVFINRNDKFKFFNDLDYPIWEHFSNYVKSRDKDNRMSLLRYKRNKVKLKTNNQQVQLNIKPNLLVKLKNVQIEFQNVKEVETYECLTDVYETEKEYIDNFSKNYFEVEDDFSEIFSKNYKIEQEVTFTDLVDREKLFNEREETLSTLGYASYDIPLQK